MHPILLVAVLAAFLQLVAARVAADPIDSRNSPITLPIRKRLNSNQSGSFKPAQRDLIRSRNLVKRDSSTLDGITNIPLNVNSTIGTYTASIGVGNPATVYDLIVDTGSSNTWVGANRPYKETSTSVKTSNEINVTYGSGDMLGTEYIDSVTIAPGVVISGQSIGVALNSSGFFPLDGILGVGPDPLTLYTLIPNNTNVIPTVTDNLFGQGLIEQKLIAVSFGPLTSALETNGELTFGSIDSSKFTEPITYFPLTKTPPSSFFWGIDASLQYGNGNGNGSVNIFNTTAGIVDTGTTLLGLATDAYNLYLSVTGGVYDKSTGLLRITPAQYNNLKSLFFEIGGTTYELIPNAQIWPRALNTLIGGQANSIYLVVFDIGSDRIGKMDFIMGMVVLERLYSVFDTGNNRVGFATTQFTNATIN